MVRGQTGTGPGVYTALGRALLVCGECKTQLAASIILPQEIKVISIPYFNSLGKDGAITVTGSENLMLLELLKSKLLKEVSENNSGEIFSTSKIQLLKEKDYYIMDIELDGDAPKSFIKAYFYEKNSGVKRRNLKTWTAFIAKSAEKWYPHESFTEYMINRIGIELGLNMNNVKLVRANGQIRFLSEYFLSPNEALTHGAEICGYYLEDHEMARQIANHKKTARELFTFEFISKAIEFVFPNAFEEILQGLVKMIAFDALVGNNDRHFYNWGVIDTIKRSKKQPKFAPIYDSARGLLWNFGEGNIVKHLETHRSSGKKIEKYISNATPRISIESDSNCNHFQLVSFIKSHKDDYNEIIDELVLSQV